MKYQGINLENVKLSNRSSILLLLNNNGAMSRKDIAETVGLTAASVTLICSEVIDQKIDMLALNVRNSISILDPKNVMLIGYMFDIPGCFERFVKAYKGYDPLVADDFFVKSTLSENSSHTEGHAVFLNEVLLTQFN